eukprot:GAFH01001165.1.p2 GENE.GAFH01001165.1~~GAFH01001165.1.p2  ORF type:complete len:606 (+),score=304.84 GAFH01001165.1:187-1818(+)
MGAGYACMNNLTVQQATQGFCAYLELVDPLVYNKGVVVGCDARHHSREFARITAAVFLAHNIPVYLFRDICATPHVPFTLTTKGCSAGVMVTASHNPKADNGYKVYWNNGSQIISPHDALIAHFIDLNQVPWEGVEATLCDRSPLCRDPVAEGLLDQYFQQTSARLCRMHSNMDPLLRPPVKFCYTAMHGVGFRFAKRMYEEFGLAKNMVPVAEQIEPNPEFPTVSYPNPEEHGALTLAMQRATEQDVNLIIANDPDADRVAVAERVDGQWHQFTGDEIGTLLAVWLWNKWRDAHRDADTSKVAFLNSAVSSKALRAVAQTEHCHYEETLTGFKWLGNRTDELTRLGYTVLFAYEEAIGYMPADLIRDKDGLTTGAVVVEMATWLANQHKTLAGYLQEARQRYGVFVPQNSYFLCYDPATIARIFARLRTAGPQGSYMNECAIDGRTFKATGIRDLMLPGYDSTTPDHKPRLPVSKGGEMITYTFENGATITLRTSGTEPKLKFYCEMCAPYPGNPREELATLVRAMVATFLEPEKNNLQPPH